MDNCYRFSEDSHLIEIQNSRVQCLLLALSELEQGQVWSLKAFPFLKHCPYNTDTVVD